jgi:lysophospholipase L1-like esterase
MHKSLLLLVLSLLLQNLSSASACPLRANIPDVNCDEKTILAFFGDSVTRGVSDPRINQYTGGMPLRLKKHLRQSLGLPGATYQIKNFGVPGISCKNMRIKLRNAILSNEHNVANADTIIIACGLNDYWEHHDATLTRFYINAMKRFVKNHGIFADVAMITPTRRWFQQPFVDEANELLIQGLGNRIRYDLMDTTTMISNDNLHPDNSGYNFMFETFSNYLFSDLFKLTATSQQGLTDADEDGVYDKFEISKFGTDPTLPDTDGDGASDSEELFNLRTDPLNSASH